MRYVAGSSRRGSVCVVSAEAVPALPTDRQWLGGFLGQKQLLGWGCFSASCCSRSGRLWDLCVVPLDSAAYVSRARKKCLQEVVGKNNTEEL